jgi:hypothetical protein
MLRNSPSDTSIVVRPRRASDASKDDRNAADEVGTVSCLTMGSFPFESAYEGDDAVVDTEAIANVAKCHQSTMLWLLVCRAAVREAIPNRARDTHADVLLLVPRANQLAGANS